MKTTTAVVVVSSTGTYRIPGRYYVKKNLLPGTWYPAIIITVISLVKANAAMRGGRERVMRCGFCRGHESLFEQLPWPPHHDLLVDKEKKLNTGCRRCVVAFGHLADILEEDRRNENAKRNYK